MKPDDSAAKIISAGIAIIVGITATAHACQQQAEVRQVVQQQEVAP